MGWLGNDACYVIAEAGLNHNGSLCNAKRLIDGAVLAGADAVKFQKRSVDELAVAEILDAADSRFPSLGSTYREIRKTLEFTESEYVELKIYAEDRGINFMVTPFDIKAFQSLKAIGVSHYKLASHSLTNLPLLEEVASQAERVVLSTGMSTLDEIDQAVLILRGGNIDFALMHCVSAYPTPVADCNLSMVDVLTKRYDCPVGYSGHEIGYLPTLAAVARGSQLVERHFTLCNNMEGFDHKMSLRVDQFIELVRAIRDVESSIGSGKKAVSDIEQLTRNKYHVSAVSKRKILAGEPLTEDLVQFKNPGTGLSPASMKNIYGLKALSDIEKDIIIKRSDFG